MATNLSRAAVLICTCFAILITPSASIRPFQFYKLALQWPNSYCNTRGVTCITPFKTYFTIHGLWPHYNRDTSVPPFNRTGCTNVTPTPANRITLALLRPIINDMTRYWPNLRNYNSMQENLRFWRYEWAQHGMCSAYPSQPLQYFNAALGKIRRYNIQTILRNAAPPIVPSNSRSYNRTAISNAIRGAVGARPEIHCNRNSRNVIQLMEVRICFNRQLNPINCPTPYTACPAGSLVRYPM